MKVRMIACVAVAAVAACGEAASPPSSTSIKTTTTVTTISSPTPTPTTEPGTAPTPNPHEAEVSLATFATGLDKPVAFAPRPGSTRLYAAEQHLGIRIINADGSLGDLVLDLRGRLTTGGEQGVLGIAFSTNGSRVYVNFTDLSGHTNIVEYEMRGDDIQDASERLVILVEQPTAYHNGGDLKVGQDQMLYIALGDGGGGGDPNRNGQNLNSRLGKILRINPTEFGTRAYSAPIDNPFPGYSSVTNEVWVYGLRNPWRISFDRANGDLWIADVGQNAYEEINVVRSGDSGINFGWSAREGFHSYNNDVVAKDAIDPLIELGHDDGNCSITGGFVYRGGSVPNLVGSYVFADYCKGDLQALDLRTTDPTVVELETNVAQVSSFGEDNAGELYVLSRTGTIYKLVHL